MAIDLNYLASLPQDQAVAYLRQAQPKLDTSGLVPVYGQGEGYSGNELLGYSRPGDMFNNIVAYAGDAPQPQYAGTAGSGYKVVLTPQFDPNYEGGTYGHYEGVYDQSGNLIDVQFKQDERSGGWFNDNLDWLGPLIVGGVATLGAGGFLPNPAGASGAATAAPGTFGAQAVEAGLAESTLGELGINTALTPAQYVGNTAYAQAIASGMTPELAQMASEVAQSLYGSGMTAADMVSSGIAAATDAAATGAVSSAGTIVGGGGAITPGLTGAGTGAVGSSWLSDLASKVGSNVGKMFTAENVANFITDPKKVIGALGVVGAAKDLISGSGSGGSGGSGGGTGGMTQAQSEVFNRSLSQTDWPRLMNEASAAGLPVATYIGTKMPQFYGGGYDLAAGQRPDYNSVTSGAIGAPPKIPVTNPTQQITNMYQQVLGRAPDPEGLKFWTNALSQGYTPEQVLAKIKSSPEAQGIRAKTGGPMSQLARFAKGAGSGRADTIPAKLSDGEYVMDAETVSLLGDGSNDEGARRLEDMRHAVRQHKGRALARGKFSPDAKSPLAYLKGAKKHG